MSENSHRLVWIDLEMTGLDLERDSIIEIATIVTDGDLTILAEGPNLAVQVADDVGAFVAGKVGRHCGHGPRA